MALFIDPRWGNSSSRLGFYVVEGTMSPLITGTWRKETGRGLILAFSLSRASESFNTSYENRITRIRTFFTLTPAPPTQRSPTAACSKPLTLFPSYYPLAPGMKMQRQNYKSAGDPHALFWFFVDAGTALSQYLQKCKKLFRRS